MNPNKRVTSEDYEVKVTNIVASIMFPCRINLKKVNRVIENTEYIPEQFPGLVLRLDKPRVSLLMFESGRIVCTGAMKAGDIDAAVKRLTKMLKKKGMRLSSPPKIEVQNIVSNGSYRGFIDLDWLHTAVPSTVYQTKQFPGLKYAMDNPKVVFLLFANGKFVCAGAKNYKQLHEGIRKMLPILKDKGAFIPYEIHL